MSEMIERVARAIDPLGWAIPNEDGHYPAERARREAKRAASMGAARAAIKAMLEPNGAMLAAMGDAVVASEYGAIRHEIPDEELLRIFTAMIDAATSRTGDA